jgi:hypothetical protein
MIVTFSARDVRKQIMHARSAGAHRSLDPSRPSMAPLLRLTRQCGRYSLVSNGVPETTTPAYAVRVDADVGPAPEQVDEERKPPDFVEEMPLEAFTKALQKTEVAIVVTRTYINVLGGQPDRVPSFLCTTRRRRQPRKA